MIERILWLVLFEWVVYLIAAVVVIFVIWPYLYFCEQEVTEP